MILKWTKEKPKVEGWYWYKGRNEKVKVVEVFRFKFQKVNGDWGFELGWEGSRLSSREPGMWAGPIPEPGE